jgi:2-amino-4-hydroxy-6-hydroxymethyldihydropteridine diphosphokinase
MPECLIALGANLDEPRRQLDEAVASLAATPGLALLARSRWRATQPVGGPTGQPDFLNGAVRVATDLTAERLFERLIEVEAQGGRVRTVRWGARRLDLDLLLYGAAEGAFGSVVLPHPRMEHRRFVLDGAAEVAPWMIHPTSGWTVACLRRQLLAADPRIAVAARDASQLAALVSGLRARHSADDAAPLRFATWDGPSDAASRRRPALVLAWIPDCPDPSDWRRMLGLPATGPVVRLEASALPAAIEEASTAVQAAFPGAISPAS